MAIDIDSRSAYPSGALSNFAPHPFELDGVQCASMEGFLQSLLTNDNELQAKVCQLVGIKAKRFGLERIEAWKEIQKLWWKGTEYDRHGPEYQALLDRAYEALFSQRKDFRDALSATGNELLIHSIGTSSPYEDILTEKEFCSRLMKLRGRIASTIF